MFFINDIRQVHLEVSSYCNARCPMCTRNTRDDTINSDLVQNQLSLADVKRIFSPEFLRQLEHIYLCGNYGDPIMGRETLEILKYFKITNENCQLSMYTNGSGRSEEWWRNLAAVVHYCQFDIDGLEDTNCLYRRGTSWAKIMASAKSFIDSGGSAGWEFIVFEHNEHQVEQARDLSLRMGFKNFVVKRTNRFQSRVSGEEVAEWPVKNKSGILEYSLKPPTSDLYKIRDSRQSSEDFESYLLQTRIKCKAKTDRSVYISADGYVFPCCWMGHIYSRGAPENEQIVSLINSLPSGRESISAIRNPLEKILAGPFFCQVVNSWRPSTPISDKLRVCGRVCGTANSVGAQFEDSKQQGLHVPGV